MPRASQGSIRLFRFAGIDLFLHWSWFLVAAFEISGQAGRYSSLTWNLAEYLVLFGIVMLHEFGHALACRQVGGTANQIVLWPLGGVAYVNPPPRPGATLWSIAAGPLVNVALLPVLLVLLMLSRQTGWGLAWPNAYHLLRSATYINLILLVFNILPIYPLDGGQILRSLLWFVIGRARSLMVATVLGFVGIIALIALAVFSRNVWLGILSVFLLMSCWGGLRQARALTRLNKVPRREGVACPKCGSAPPVGDHWKCGHCEQSFDFFQNQGICPYCAGQFSATRCLECGNLSTTHEWLTPASAVVKA